MSSDHPRATAGSLQRDLAGIRPAAEVKRLVVIINFIDPIPSLEWRGDVFSIQAPYAPRHSRQDAGGRTRLPSPP